MPSVPALLTTRSSPPSSKAAPVRSWRWSASVMSPATATTRVPGAACGPTRSAAASSAWRPGRRSRATSPPSPARPPVPRRVPGCACHDGHAHGCPPFRAVGSAPPGQYNKDFLALFLGGVSCPGQGRSAGASGSAAQPIDFSTAGATTAWPASASSTGSCGSKTASASQSAGELVERRPHPLGQPGEGGRTERGRLGRARAVPPACGSARPAARGGGPWRRRPRPPAARRVGADEAAAMASVMSRTWKAMRLDAGAGQLGPAGAAGEAGDDAAGLRDPTTGCRGR